MIAANFSYDSSMYTYQNHNHNNMKLFFLGGGNMVLPVSQDSRLEFSCIQRQNINLQNKEEYFLEFSEWFYQTFYVQ